jgi:PAS domain S-box-containing protein
MRAYSAAGGVAVYLRKFDPPPPTESDRAYDRSHALEEEWKRLEMAVAGGDLGTWDLFFDTGHCIFNDRWAEILGYELGEVEPTDTFFYEHVHPDDRGRVQRAVDACARKERPMMDLEIRMRHTDGTWRWVLDRGKVLEWNDDGSPRRMVGTHMDITERKRAKEALRQERDLLQRVFDASPAAIVVLDADGIILRASDRIREVLGVGAEEARGRRYDDSSWGIEALDGTPLDPDHLPFSTVMQEARSIFDHRHAIHWPDGTRRLISISGAPLFHAARAETAAERENEQYPTGAIFVLEDVTERYRAKQALKRSEERFRTVSEQAVDVVAIFAPDGTFQYVSPSAERVTGRARNELIGTEAFAHVHPDDYHRLWSAFEEALSQPDGTVEVEGRFRHRNGTWRHLSIRARRISSQKGPQVLANVRDVTDEQRRREELMAAKAEAEEASRLKSSMLANMSHEVRTPLTSIIGFADLLIDLDLGETPERFAQLIRRSGTRLLDTLDAVLDLSQLEAGAMQYKEAPTRVGRLLQDLVGEMEGQARVKDIELTLSCAVGEVQADQRVLRTVLTNLIGNAIKFTEPGGHVGVSAEASAEEIVFVVEDTGIGMSPHFVARALQAFQQESTGADRRFEGSGLGLTITHRCLELVGGTIEIDTEKGRGTRMEVRIPRGG